MKINEKTSVGFSLQKKGAKLVGAQGKTVHLEIPFPEIKDTKASVKINDMSPFLADITINRFGLSSNDLDGEIRFTVALSSKDELNFIENACFCLEDRVIFWMHDCRTTDLEKVIQEFKWKVKEQVPIPDEVQKVINEKFYQIL